VDVAGGITASGVQVMPVTVIPEPMGDSKGLRSCRIAAIDSAVPRFAFFETFDNPVPAVKLIEVMLAPLIVTVWLVGENARPARLGVTVYVPLTKPVNV
jgi:hypothetical protein